MAIRDVEIPTVTTRYSTENSSLISGIELYQKYSGSFEAKDEEIKNKFLAGDLKAALGLGVKQIVTGRAILSPSADASAADLSALQEALIRSGFSKTYSDTNGNLVVEGITNDKALKKLADTLAENKFITSSALTQSGDVRYGTDAGHVEETEFPKQEGKVSVGEKIFEGRKKLSEGFTRGTGGWTPAQRLSASGFVGLIGHAALFIRGAIERSPNLMQTAMFYGSSAAVPWRYGTGDQSLKAMQLMEEFGGTLKKDSLNLEDDNVDGVHRDIEKNKTVVKKLDEAIAKNPVLAMQLFGVWGNFNAISVGFKRKEYGLAVHGLAGFASAIIGGLVKEREATPEEQKKLGDPDFKGISRFLLETKLFVVTKPLFTQGMFYIVDNVAMLYDSFSIGIHRKQILEGHDKYPGGLIGKLLGKTPEHIPPLKDQIAIKVAEYNTLIAKDGLKPVDLNDLESQQGMRFEGLPEANGLRDEIIRMQRHYYEAKHTGFFSSVLAKVTAFAYTTSTLLYLSSTKNPDAALSTRDEKDNLIAAFARKAYEMPEVVALADGEQFRARDALVDRMADFLTAKLTLDGGHNRDAIYTALREQAQALAESKFQPYEAPEQLEETRTKYTQNIQQKGTGWAPSVHSGAAPAAMQP